MGPAPDAPAAAAVEPPEVSVVVLTRERPAMLARCLHSLRAQTTHVPFEVVVADDGSGPETARVVAAAAARDARVRHVRHPHSGIAATRNLGLRAASSQRYVAFVADDYVLAPDYLTCALAYLEAVPAAGVVRFRVRPLHDHFGSRVSHCYYDASVLRRRLLDGADRPLSTLDRIRLLRRLPDAANDAGETRLLEAAGAAVFRREVLDGLGGWDARLRRAEDTELTGRLRRAGHEVHFHPACVVAHEYGTLPLDTLKKCFETGYSRALLAGAPGSEVVAAKLSGLAVVAWRVRAAGSVTRMVTYLPWLALFEAATLAGHLRARLGRTRRAPCPARMGGSRLKF